MVKGGKTLFKGIEKADSVTLDPHKALFLPMGNGALLVRDPRLLEAAHAVEMGYLPNEQAESEYNPSKLSLELLRPSRGLQLWLPLKVHGIQPFVDYHEEKLALTHYAHQELKKIPGVEFLHEPEVAALVFRLGARYASAEKLDELNKRVIERVNDAETKISGATFKNGFWLRIVPFGLRTHKPHVDRTLNRIKSVIDSL